MRNFLVTESGAVRGLLFQTGLIPDADIFGVFFFTCFLWSRAQKEKRREPVEVEGEKKEGGGLVISPRGSEKGGGGSAAKGPTFDFVGRR